VYPVFNTLDSKGDKTMKTLSRSTALKIAAVLTLILNAYSVVFALPMVTLGADAVIQNPEMIPYFIALLVLVVGVIGMVAVYGVWKQQRWGIILAIVTSLVHGLSAAPGMLNAPSVNLQVIATLYVVSSVVIIVLCLWRDRRVGVASTGV
jgi:uncharacterized membrane protein (DUF2068 family)